MGYIKHHTIIVTSFDDDLLIKAHKKAKTLFPTLCSQILEGVVNNYTSFFIAPDGSKEFWETSRLHDQKRNEFVEWIKKQKHNDGSNNLSFVEVSYGEDNGECKVTNHN